MHQTCSGGNDEHSGTLIEGPCDEEGAVWAECHTGDIRRMILKYSSDGWMGGGWVSVSVSECVLVGERVRECVSVSVWGGGEGIGGGGGGMNE